MAVMIRLDGWELMRVRICRGWDLMSGNGWVRIDSGENMSRVRTDGGELMGEKRWVRIDGWEWSANPNVNPCIPWDVTAHFSGKSLFSVINCIVFYFFLQKSLLISQFEEGQAAELLKLLKLLSTFNLKNWKFDLHSCSAFLWFVCIFYLGLIM